MIKAMHKENGRCECEERVVRGAWREMDVSRESWLVEPRKSDIGARMYMPENSPVLQFLRACGSAVLLSFTALVPVGGVLTGQR